MKKSLIYSVLTATIVGISCPVFPQTTDFNLDAYKEFLLDNQDMSPTQLLEMFSSGYFLDEVDDPDENALFIDSIDLVYSLTADEKYLLGKNGFVVTERLRQPTFNDQFREIYENDLPVFISTDAILHAYHRSYDAILREVEEGFLFDKLKSLLTKMHSSQNILAISYEDRIPMEKMLQDVDVYLTVPLMLLGEDVHPYYNANEKVVADIQSFIHEEQVQDYPLFSDDCTRTIDFSQFKPRGHYTQSDELEQYFMAMMWMGRTELYLNMPESSDDFSCSEKQRFDMVTRQAVDALLLSELLELSGADQDYGDMEQVVSFFVGEQDNVTYPQLQALKSELGISDASALLDSQTLREFQLALSTKTFSDQRILSQILFSDPQSPDAIKAAPAFMLFGPRFVIDSYITGNVVFDQILYQGTKPCRLYPSTLDILFAFGNDASSQLLIPELQKYSYSSNLAGLRYLMDQYGDDFWESSLYCMWLKAIKSLSPPVPGEREDLPSFMQTGAWGLEKMNTQLASWAELRHDNLLYAKQSYSGGQQCSYPGGYVEPVPGFYDILNRTAKIATDRFNMLGIVSDSGDTLINYLQHLEYVTSMLKGISEKELNHICLDSTDIGFIKSLYIRDRFICSPIDLPPVGWYPELFYHVDDIENPDFVVADYHTTPADCAGNPIGAISHAGTGNIDLLVAVTELQEGHMMAFIGPVMSYHEYVTSNFLRLTDEEWEETYFRKSFRPEWAKGYLTDTTGQSVSSVWKLAANELELEEILNTDNSEPTSDPDIYSKSLISMINAPNPFSNYTLISFTVPGNLRNLPTRLSVYDLQGREINNLVYEVLPPGHYIYRWDVKSVRGASIPPGIYLVKIWVGNMDETLKVIVSK